MRTKNLISIILIASMLLAGCRAKAEQGSAGTKYTEETTTMTSEATVTPTNTPTPSPSPTPTVKIENMSNNDEGHYSFQPHVFSKSYLAEFGEEKRDCFFAYCDALCKGEETFDCPDEEFYYWCFGALSNFFFPFSMEYASPYSQDKRPSWKDGKGYIYYTVSKEEYLEKEKAFEKEIEDILNDCLSDDYTDLEKTLALYEYMTMNYEYDMDMYDNLSDRSDELSPYRCLKEKRGICCEIAGLYSYLLLQAGVDSDEIGGDGEFNGQIEGHSWVYVTLDGQPYHIDPTWGVDNYRPPLCYYLMTDELRMDRDGFRKDTFSLGVSDEAAREAFEFQAADDRYSTLWSGFYMGMDRENKFIYYEDESGQQQKFSYAA